MDRRARVRVVRCHGSSQESDVSTTILAGLDAKSAHYAAVANQIWGFAEVGYQEYKSSALLRRELATAGFKVDSGIAGMPTAFTATYGTGKPIIAIIGEFDALPGLSQDAVPDKKLLINGGPGHGCGHNLFGTASVASAIAVKEWMSANKIAGTLRFYGTPAEEGGSGKVYMVRDGMFDDVDAVVTWHPGRSQRVGREQHPRQRRREVPLSRHLGPRCRWLRKRAAPRSTQSKRWTTW